jgi:hypothetical protein
MRACNGLKTASVYAETCRYIKWGQYCEMQVKPLSSEIAGLSIAVQEWNKFRWFEARSGNNKWNFRYVMWELLYALCSARYKIGLQCFFFVLNFPLFFEWSGCINGWAHTDTQRANVLNRYTTNISSSIFSVAHNILRRSSLLSILQHCVTLPSRVSWPDATSAVGQVIWAAQTTLPCSLSCVTGDIVTPNTTYRCLSPGAELQ